MFLLYADESGDPLNEAERHFVLAGTAGFDLFLTRQYNAGNTQRGLTIFDDCRHEQRLQALMHSYARQGTPYGRLKNFADVPVFADSRASRMLQIADFIAWALFRRYERSVANYFDRIVGKFDREGDRLHGLLHRTANFQNCFCPACYSRRAAAV